LNVKASGNSIGKSQCSPGSNAISIDFSVVVEIKMINERKMANNLSMKQIIAR
jgi:hypothetical protein